MFCLCNPQSLHSAKQCLYSAQSSAHVRVHLVPRAMPVRGLRLALALTQYGEWTVAHSIEVRMSTHLPLRISLRLYNQSIAFSGQY